MDDDIMIKKIIDHFNEFCKKDSEEISEEETKKEKDFSIY